jgi:N-acylneuraminate cytidylyltransferase
MYYSEQGDEMKKFNTRDGVALRLFQDAGVRVGIITAEDRDLNRRRSAKLNLDFEYHAVSDKKSVLDELCSKFHVQPEQIAYVGDDLNDLGLLRSVGFSFCPSDAHLRVRSQVAYQCKAQGGQGVIREIFDLYSTQENP